MAIAFATATATAARSLLPQWLRDGAFNNLTTTI